MNKNVTGRFYSNSKVFRRKFFINIQYELKIALNFTVLVIEIRRKEKM